MPSVNRNEGSKPQRKPCFALAKIPNDNKEHPKDTLVFWMVQAIQGNSQGLPKLICSGRDTRRIVEMLLLHSAFFQVCFFRFIYLKLKSSHGEKQKQRAFPLKNIPGNINFWLALQNQTFEKLKWIICEYFEILRHSKLWLSNKKLNFAKRASTKNPASGDSLI